MPRRKRHDPAISAPVDGDYAYDHLKNKQKGRVYFIADEEDAERLKSFGAVVERRNGEPTDVVPAFDAGGEKGSVVKVRNLTVLSMSIEQEKAYRRPAMEEADARAEMLKAQAEASGGHYTTTTL
jgi:hypothetical protein